MRLAASALSAARPLAPYLRIATQRPSPPTQPQARPRTAAALRPHGLHSSSDRKHGPAAIQPKTPGRGWRPAARSAPPALLGQCRGKGRACGRGLSGSPPRPLTGRGAEVGLSLRWARGGWLGSAHRCPIVPPPRSPSMALRAAARALCCVGPPQRWPHAARPALPPARLGGCSGRGGRPPNVGSVNPSLAGRETPMLRRDWYCSRMIGIVYFCCLWYTGCSLSGGDAHGQ